MNMKVVTFGELLLRLTSPGYTRLFQNNILETSFCGAEANVAVSLANFGIDVSFVTKLPENDIGRAAINQLRYFGVDVTKVIQGDGRMGMYYLEKGASQRSSKVIYDRKNSTLAMAQENEFDWASIFKNVSWFHWTGINPALSDNLITICEQACIKAKEQGIFISCDLNYRNNLWSSQKAYEIMSKFMPYVDLCIANEEDAEKVLGIVANNTNVQEGKLDKNGYLFVANEICKNYGCQYVAITLRESYSASVNGWSGMLYSAKKQKGYFSTKYDIQIVDRVGGGDSFAAGIIYALLTEKNEQDAIQFAVAASCLKHTLEGDFNRTTIHEIEKLLNSNGNGRVER